MNFNATKDETTLIRKAAVRALAMDRAANGANAQDIMDWSMDLTACHCNGTPLDLEKLNAFDNFNFAHDAFGISRHIDRTTGKLKNCFLPRCAVKVHKRNEPGVLGRAIRERAKATGN